MAEVHAAGESVLAIRHEDLAVIALVEAGEAVIEGIERVEGAQRDATLFEPVEKCRLGGQRTDGVVQHIDMDTARGSLPQQFAQTTVTLRV